MGQNSDKMKKNMNKTKTGILWMKACFTILYTKKYFLERRMYVNNPA